jgi:hypothetical protein
MVTTDVEGLQEGGSVPTFFASPERAREGDLRRQIEEVSSNPVIDALVASVSGLLAVLNEHRQIVALNDTLLNAIGVKDSGEVLGLRPGEAIRCVHADELAGGCGTSRYCSTCGAAIAIVSAPSRGGAEWWTSASGCVPAPSSSRDGGSSFSSCRTSPPWRGGPPWSAPSFTT